MGDSVNDYIMNVRLRTARFLLLHSEKPISEIAYEVGFSSRLIFHSFHEQIEHFAQGIENRTCREILLKQFLNSDTILKGRRYFSRLQSFAKSAGPVFIIRVLNGHIIAEQKVEKVGTPLKRFPRR